MPPGHSVLALPLKFSLIALILAFFCTRTCKLPRSMVALPGIAAWFSNPWRNSTGSTKLIPTIMPLPEARGFSSFMLRVMAEFSRVRFVFIRGEIVVMPALFPFPADGFDAFLTSSANLGLCIMLLTGSLIDPLTAVAVQLFQATDVVHE